MKYKILKYCRYLKHYNLQCWFPKHKITDYIINEFPPSIWTGLTNKRVSIIFVTQDMSNPHHQYVIWNADMIPDGLHARIVWYAKLVHCFNFRQEIFVSLSCELPSKIYCYLFYFRLHSEKHMCNGARTLSMIGTFTFCDVGILNFYSNLECSRMSIHSRNLEQIILKKILLFYFRTWTRS